MKIHNSVAIIAFFLSCMLPTMSEAASFDCSKAETPFEKTICADPKLSNLDEELAKDYGNALQALSDDGKKILSDGQRRWLLFANNNCFKYKNTMDNSACVRRSYETRIKDMKTAAVQIGPFLFSRIDYYFSKSDDEFGRSYEGHTSYPRIDNPSSDNLKKWNAIMAPKSEAEGEGWCDGNPGDVDIGFEIKSATNTAISAKQSNWMYCHGAAHGYGGTNGVTYILTPEPHLLKASDLFIEGGQWKEFLTEQCYNAMVEKAKKEEITIEIARGSIENEATTPSAWGLTKDGIVVTISPPFYVFGPTEVPISWDDLRPFLLPTAPIPMSENAAELVGKGKEAIEHKDFNDAVSKYQQAAVGSGKSEIH